MSIETSQQADDFGLIQQLRIQQVRNIQQAELNHLAQLNVFYGANGSGKSSVLEAVGLLFTGRSFRTGQPRQAIAQGQSECTVFASNDLHRMGMQRQQSGEVTFRLDGREIATQSEVSQWLPVQIMSPEGMDLVDGGSQARRRMLDWLLFHCEPAFHPVWLRYQRALRQRNGLLKQTSLQFLAYPEVQAQFDAWEQELADTGEKIDQLRQKVITAWQPIFDEVWQSLGPTQADQSLAITLRYQPGFDNESGLRELLKQDRPRDCDRGHTQHGSHRADLRLRGPIGLVSQTFSRGQKKLLIFALRVSQVLFLARLGRGCVVLLDDLTAELDRVAQANILTWLQHCKAQVFLTVLQPDQLDDAVKIKMQSACWFRLLNGHIEATDTPLSN